jgi:hypothetical protein
MQLEFSRQIFEKCSSNFTKIRPVVAELFHVEVQADRETNIMQLIAVFLNFVHVPEKHLLQQN